MIIFEVTGAAGSPEGQPSLAYWAIFSGHEV